MRKTLAEGQKSAADQLVAKQKLLENQLKKLESEKDLIVSAIDELKEFMQKQQAEALTE